MAKRLETRLTKNKAYESRVGRPLSELEIDRLYHFHKHVGYTPDRVNAIIQCVLLGYTDWVEVWHKLKLLHNGVLEYWVMLYGEIEGKMRYEDINHRKTKKFDHSPAMQRIKGLKSALLSKGNKEWSVRGIGYWINKGFTETEAKEKVREIQTTNSLTRYIKKYGDQEGTQKFYERNNVWKSVMACPTIQRKRSLGLWRYVERYGEAEGERKYFEMRVKRNSECSIGRASKESLSSFSCIIQLLEENNVRYYFGCAGNKEWYIYNKNVKKMFFYDLTIPTLGMIIEYHGEGFHPNPNWNSKQLSDWKQVRTGKSSTEVLNYTALKNNTAKENGWKVIEVYSSMASITVPETKKIIIESIHALQQSHTSQLTP